MRSSFTKKRRRPARGADLRKSAAHRAVSYIRNAAQLRAFNPYTVLGLYLTAFVPRASAEADFVVSGGRGVVPVEVKAEVNLRAKSLKAFRDKYNRGFPCGRR